ncbi:MAG: Unknown protein [uncultured Sulfurovum sp.]|uniref:Cytochrome c domain-containing protein n=1 Tax=uncultured Sulfurovum sp. TaxID=269237 RepID=A0A6S6TQY6_9BACT|nr:MAG: Unknown protein [uncultured Sulfurovum sp.]
MEKIIFVCLCLVLSLKAQEKDVQIQELENRCLTCHKQEQIPSERTYRRYLMKYSTKEVITVAMIKYLKDPKKELSAMPPQFLSRFPMKLTLDLDEVSLNKYVEAYIERFDVKKKLIFDE